MMSAPAIMLDADGASIPMDGASGLPLDDIQGIILRGYNFDAVRYFVLKVISADQAHKMIGRLATDAELKISNSRPWGSMRPEYQMQVGFTYAGLVALQLEADSLSGFRAHKAFFEGAAARAARLGDLGINAPEKWIKPFDSPALVHMIITLYADDAVVEKWTTRLRSLWVGVLEELTVCNGHVLPDYTVHFGYQDGISQPVIAGAPAPASPSHPEAPASSFLLGYESPWPSFNLPVPRPAQLGNNGSFAAFRILQQDVAAFEQYLTVAAEASGQDREWIAAKMCGRWRNGVPLILSPNTSNPDPPLPESALNNFDYSGDPQGILCPIGSHTRRGFPRGDSIAGGPGAAFRRRIIRRGMPYGPKFDASHPTPAERGLLGLFICASIDEQFEFIQREWMNRGGFTGELPVSSRDPLIHVDVPGGTQLPIPMPNQPPLKLPEVEQLVTTRGAAYLFLPSLTALQYIGSLL